MLGVQARNVNDALYTGLHLLHKQGMPRACRPNTAGATVLEVPHPVATTYLMPCERVLWDPLRDANPFFHFFEALWIIAGRQDVAFLTRFNKRMANFSDDGTTFHAPYGYRLRYPMDQIGRVIGMLVRDHDNRRAVLQVWDYALDLDLGWDCKDIPCNDMVFCKVRNNQLDITVCCRSNDVIWGAYGANVVQFSMLQEYMAAHIGIGVGEYTQISDSYHVYEDNPFWQQFKSSLDGEGRSMWVRNDPYTFDDGPVPYPLFRQPSRFDSDLLMFFNGFDSGYMPARKAFASDAFDEVVMPMFYAHTLYRDRNYDAALRALSQCAAQDWRAACGAWIMRRVEAQPQASKLVLP